MLYPDIIFDLYGTLVDIRTNEDKPSLWKKLALFYGYYGAHYDPEELHQAYLTTVSRLETDLRSELISRPGFDPHLKSDLKSALRSESASYPMSDSESTITPAPSDSYMPAPAHMDDVHEAHPEIQIEPVFSALYADKGISADDALVVHTGQFFRVLSTERLRLYPHAAELLSTLRSNGAHVYLLSNAQRIFTEYEMHLLRIADAFDDIFISSDCGTKKPDARFFRLLLDKHHIEPSHAIMIGNDGTSDIAGARAVGLHTIYIRSAISPKEELPAADYALKRMDLHRVEKILLQQR